MYTNFLKQLFPVTLEKFVFDYFGIKREKKYSLLLPLLKDL